jgi:hypothetical protein
MTGPLEYIVEVDSATYCRPEETEAEHIAAIDRPHSNLVKFADHEGDLERVTERIRDLAEQNRVLPTERLPSEES